MNRNFWSVVNTTCKEREFSIKVLYMQCNKRKLNNRHVFKWIVEHSEGIKYNDSDKAICMSCAERNSRL